MGHMLNVENENKSDMKVIEGKLNAKGLKFGIVIGRFNDLSDQNYWVEHWMP
ncbi:MAG: hypothetical protein R2759_08305 [Bacteroidales bacterium]